MMSFWIQVYFNDYSMKHVSYVFHTTLFRITVNIFEDIPTVSSKYTKSLFLF